MTMARTLLSMLAPAAAVLPEASPGCAIPTPPPAAPARRPRPTAREGRAGAGPRAGGLGRGAPGAPPWDTRQGRPGSPAGAQASCRASCHRRDQRARDNPSAAPLLGCAAEGSWPRRQQEVPAH